MPPSSPASPQHMLRCSLCQGLEVCKAAAHGWCREAQGCELWSCCCAGRSSGCASAAEAGAGRAPGGAGEGLLQLFDLQPQQEMQSGAGLAAVAALGVCGVDADGTAAGRSSCRSRCCLCSSLVRLPAAAALSEVFPACLPPLLQQHHLLSTVAADSAVGTYCHCPPPPKGAAEVLTVHQTHQPSPTCCAWQRVPVPFTGNCVGPASCSSEGGGSVDHRNTSQGSVVHHVPSLQPLYVHMEKEQ